MKKERVQQYKDFLKSQHGKVNKSLYITMGGIADEGVAIKPENIELLVNFLSQDLVLCSIILQDSFHLIL